MVFKYLKYLFATDVLIELSENQVAFKIFGSDVSYVTKPTLTLEKKGDDEIITAIGSESIITDANSKTINPFSHPRAFVGDFIVAEKILQHGMQQIFNSKLSPSPRVVMHQLEKNEGGLTFIEERVLRELAAGAGAREVIVYLGDRLDVQTDSFDSVKNSLKALL